MSVQSIGADPSPAAYTYTPALPAGLSAGSATAPASSTSASSGSSTTAASSTSASAITSYQSAYASLLQQDTAELVGVSLGSISNAQSNVASVLAQAASLQAQQLASQQAAQQAAASANASTTSATDPLQNVPTLQSVIDQSNSDAQTALAQSGTTSVDTYA